MAVVLVAAYFAQGEALQGRFNFSGGRNFNLDQPGGRILPDGVKTSGSATSEEETAEDITILLTVSPTHSTETNLDIPYNSTDTYLIGEWDYEHNIDESRGCGILEFALEENPLSFAFSNVTMNVTYIDTDGNEQHMEGLEATDSTFSTFKPDYDDGSPAHIELYGVVESRAVDYGNYNPVYLTYACAVDNSLIRHKWYAESKWVDDEDIVIEDAVAELGVSGGFLIDVTE